MLASKVHFGVVSSRNHGIEVSTLETIPKSSSFLYTQSGDKKTLPSDQSRYTGIRSSWIKIYNASPSSAAQQHQNGSRSRHLRSMFQIIPSPREWTGAALGLPKILCLSRSLCLKKLLYSQREDNPTWLSVSVCNAHKAIKELESARHCENATFQLPCYLFRNSTSKACDGKPPAIFINIQSNFDRTQFRSQSDLIQRGKMRASCGQLVIAALVFASPVTSSWSRLHWSRLPWELRQEEFFNRGTGLCWTAAMWLIVLKNIANHRWPTTFRALGSKF